MVDFLYFFQVNFAFSQESLTEDEFFGENIVNNLAAFLGIPNEKIRVMEIVSASSKRKRRTAEDSQLTTITVRLSIGSFLHSFVCSFVPSLLLAVHLFVRYFVQLCSFVYSFLRSFFFVLRLFVCSFVPSSVLWCICSFVTLFNLFVSSFFRPFVLFSSSIVMFKGPPFCQTPFHGTLPCYC